MNARLALLQSAMAAEDGIAIKGNHTVVRTIDRVAFYYRGTPIVEWMFNSGEVVDLYTAFESTAATIANRKKARDAIREYRFELAERDERLMGVSTHAARTGLEDEDE